MPSRVNKGLIVATGATWLLLAGAAPALAAERYAEPGGNGPAASCPQADPCSLQAAVEDPVVVGGDEVILGPGDYELGNDPLVVNTAITVHGADGQVRPRLLSNAANALTVSNQGATVRDLELGFSGSFNGLLLNNGLVERVVVLASTGFAACQPVGNVSAVIRDSVCATNDPGGLAVGLSAGGGGALTPALRNVTAVATAAGGTGVFVAAVDGTDISIDARNMIASGEFDARAQTNSAASTSAVLNLTNSNYDTPSATGTGAAVTAPGTSGNQTAGPVFVNAAVGDFHQATGSPTIDAGLADPLNGSLDFDRETRVQGTAIDIGADETSPPTPPGRATRTISLDASKSKVRKGQKVRLSGGIEAATNEAACEAGQTVEIDRARKGGSFRAFKVTSTSQGGDFDLKVRVRKTYRYRADVAETDACESDGSNTEKVKAKKRKRR